MDEFITIGLMKIKKNFIHRIVCENLNEESFEFPYIIKITTFLDDSTDDVFLQYKNIVDRDNDFSIIES